MAALIGESLAGVDSSDLTILIAGHSTFALKPSLLGSYQAVAQAKALS
jgi:hypothetical protein